MDTVCGGVNIWNWIHPVTEEDFKFSNLFFHPNPTEKNLNQIIKQVSTSILISETLIAQFKGDD